MVLDPNFWKEQGRKEREAEIIGLKNQIVMLKKEIKQIKEVQNNEHKI